MQGTAISSKTVAVALLDPQLDYIPQCPSANELAAWRPTTALLSIRNLPIVSKYILVTPTEHASVAHRLAPLLRDAIRGMIHKRIKNRDAANAFISGIEESVYVREVQYDNIWDIGSCSKTLSPLLKAALPKTAKTNNAETHKKPTFIISLLGSTAAARTALYLTAKRLERTTDQFKLALVKHLDIGKAGNAARLSFSTDASSCSNGLLRQGVGTQHPGYGEALDRLERVIQVHRATNILITGPTGAGKSELGKLIIDYMQALDCSMNSANCIVQNIAALPPNLIESELFGHEEGAFTGANKQHKGIFERGNRGIIFLDEIGELPLHLQVKLLTVLDGTPFTRIGGTEPISSRFLLLCGTNKDLRRACSEGKFRQDLLERLNTWHIDVPPIKNRPNDIERALQRELGEWEAAHKCNVLPSPHARGFFLEKARQCAWEGNFREFHATFLHLALFADKEGITEQAIADEFKRKDSCKRDEMHALSEMKSSSSGAFETAYDMAEMARLACALDACRQCKTAKEAGELLFAARSESAKQQGTGFNGTSSLQRVFAAFGLKAQFNHGTFSVSVLKR